MHPQYMFPWRNNKNIHLCISSPRAMHTVLAESLLFLMCISLYYEMSRDALTRLDVQWETDKLIDLNFPYGYSYDLGFVPYLILVFITKTCLFKYTENFIPPKNENFQIKISDIFHISAQNIDCGYLLELPS